MRQAAAYENQCQNELQNNNTSNKSNKNYSIMATTNTATDEISNVSSDQISNMQYRKCRSQNVWRILQRSTMNNWMLATFSTDGEKNICTKTVDQFRLLLRSNENAKIKLSMRLSKETETYSLGNNKKNENFSITKNTRGGLMLVNSKAKKGRGSRRDVWLEVLYKDNKPFDSFVVQKFKDAWRHRCDECNLS